MSTRAELPLLRKPRRLQPGDRVALVAPAGAVDRERIAGAVGLLRQRGLVVVCRDDIVVAHRYLAGDDGRRSAELLGALQDPEVRAVFLARGGFGTQRLLDGLEQEGLGEPKPVIGFSDNTALLLHLRDRCGWAVVHGPHPQGEKPDELDAVLACLGYYGEPSRPAFLGLAPVGGAGATGTLQAEVGGGCLSLLCASLGTPGGFRAAGRIVFLEDTGEPVYRLDRMLTQLRRSGALEDAAAVVFGRPGTFLAVDADPVQLADLLQEFACALPCPVLSGLSCGHLAPNLPLPFGPRALLDPGRGCLTFLEDVVAA